MRVRRERLAQIVGRTPRTLANWLDEGCPRKSDGWYETAEVIDWLLGRNNSTSAAREQKTRLLRAQAEKTELDAARLRNELVPIAAVQQLWNRMLGAFRARLLALPSKLAPLVAAAAERTTEQRQLLAEAVHECLMELSQFNGDNDDDRSASEDAQSEHPAAPAKAQRQRVGGSRKKAQPGIKRRARTVAHGQGAVSARRPGRIQRPRGRARGGDEVGAGGSDGMPE